MPFKNKVKAKEYEKLYRERNKAKTRIYNKQYREQHKEKFAEYKSNWYKTKRLDKYGIIQEEFDTNLKSQNFACAICKISFSDTNRVSVDHCHNSGRVRGLVCFHCNTGLGHFKDDSNLLQKAIDYLNDPPFNYTGLPG